MQVDEVPDGLAFPSWLYPECCRCNFSQSRAGHRIAPAVSLAGVLAENNRLSDFVRISNTFDDLLSAARGEVVATITTAVVRARVLPAWRE